MNPDNPYETFRRLACKHFSFTVIADPKRSNEAKAWCHDNYGPDAMSNLSRGFDAGRVWSWQTIRWNDQPTKIFYFTEVMPAIEFKLRFGDAT